MDTVMMDANDAREPAIGDVVSLITGSPDMVVIAVCEAGVVEVAWYDEFNGMNVDVLFPVEALVLEDDDNDGDG